MIPESTSPVPAVARAGTPAADSSTSGTDWSAAATAVSGPLSSTMTPSWRARSRAAARRSSPGGRAGQAGVLAVVGGEHGRGGAQAQEELGRGEVTEGGEAVGVDRPAAAGDEATTAWISSTRGAVRAEARPDHQGLAPRRGRQEGTGPTMRGQRRPHRLDRPGPRGIPRRPQPDHPGAGGHGPPGAQHGGSLHADRAGGDAQGGGPLVRRPRPGREQGRGVAVLHQRGGRRAGADADVGHRDVAAEARALALEESRLRGGEGHRVGGLHRAVGWPHRYRRRAPDGRSTDRTGVPSGTDGAS